MIARDSIAATLDALETSEPFGLFLRHADREAIPPADPYADVDLTRLGVSNADALGKRMAGRLTWTATSPFKRCRRTAELLYPSPPEDDSRLGAPGPWITDEGLGAAIFARMGTNKVVRAQIEGIALDAVRSLPDGSRILLSTALDRIASGHGSGACITHDAVIMPALHWLTGDPLGDWLAPLDGFAIQRRGTGWVCVWRGRVHPVRS